MKAIFRTRTGISLPCLFPALQRLQSCVIPRTSTFVLMDVQTEHRENGLAAAEKIRKAHPEIKIVVATSLIDRDVAARAKSRGADSLWYKDGR